MLYMLKLSYWSYSGVLRVCVYNWPHCQRPWGGVWWWGIWTRPPNWCWWCVRTACPPGEGCSHSFHLCTESYLKRQRYRRYQVKMWTCLWIYVHSNNCKSSRQMFPKSYKGCPGILMSTNILLFYKKTQILINNICPMRETSPFYTDIL